MKAMRELETGVESLYSEIFKPALDQVADILSLDPSSAKQVLTSFYPVLRGSRFGWRAYSKPMGYAGDYRTIEMIYNPTISYTDTLSDWAMDKWCLNSSSGQGVSLRRPYLVQKVRDAVADAGGEAVNVMSIASGPGAEISDWVQENYHTCNPIHFWCVDNDAEALQFAQYRLARSAIMAEIQTLSNAMDVSPPRLSHIQGQQDPKRPSLCVEGLATFIKANVLYASRGRAADPRQHCLPQQDLIYSSGLIDYLQAGNIVEAASYTSSPMEATPTCSLWL
ncbi:hypothetical protein WJX73_004132 [Symbiochloris irregularis]|uniref:Uncharacterized protein n=1 Tax=Symbiochloris irregularis TaxID=706552 RepID=A0AAW1NT86_9CHLO